MTRALARVLTGRYAQFGKIEMTDKNKSLLSQAKARGAVPFGQGRDKDPFHSGKAGIKTKLGQYRWERRTWYRVLLVQLIGRYSPGFTGCKWGTGPTYP